MSLKKIAKSLIKTGIGCLLFVYVVINAGLSDRGGWQGFFSVLRGAQPMFLVLSLAMQPLQQLQMAFKWYVLTKSLELKVSFRYLFRCYLIGRFFNMVVPGGVGGDLARAHLLGKKTGMLNTAIASVVADRLVGLLVLLFLTGLTLPFINAFPLQTSQLVLGYIVVAVAVGAAWGVFLKRQALFSRWPGKRYRFIGSATDWLGQQVILLRQVSKDRGAMRAIFAQGLFFYFLSVMNVWITVAVFSPKFVLLDAFVAVPLMMFITNMPLSIGNLGTMEFAYVLVLSLYGVEGDVALASALLMRMKMLGGGLLGGLLLLDRGMEKKLTV